MVELAAAGSEVVALLRTAASQLLPVVLEMGPDQARYAAFVSSVEGEGGDMCAVLEPVAADALPATGGPFTIVPADRSAEWVVSAIDIAPDGARRARVGLGRARVLARREDGAVPVELTDLLVLVVPGGIPGGNTYVFPIQRIGEDSCEIRIDVGLPAGKQLDVVEIVGDRRLLRRASAEVLESVPCYMADGARSFTCRMALAEEQPLDSADPHDLVTDASEVRRLLGHAGSLQVSGWFEAPGWGRGTLRLLEVGKDSMKVELETEPRDRAAPPRNVRIGFELFAQGYEVDVRGLALDGPLLSTALPLILRRRRRHKRDLRVSVTPPHRVDLSFRHPVTGAVHTHALTELSFFSVCFACEPHQSVFWSGLPLEQAQVSWNDRLVHLGDIVVEQHGYDHASGATRCVVSIQQSSVADHPDMISLLATLAHPQVRAHDGHDFSALHRTYLKAGLFGPHMHRNLAPIMEQTEEVWRKLHGDASDVARTFVHGAADSPDAAVTIVRAWEHAWVLQHFVDVSPEITGATGRLQAAYLDHLVLRPDGRYLVFFVKTDNHVMNAYLRRFFASIGTPDSVARSSVELWSRPPDARAHPSARRDSECRPCRAEDELLVARAVERSLGPYAAAALSMVPGELSLPDSQARFARAALIRSRDCRLVTRNDTPVYALIEEQTTPGMNLTWMLNATWVIPVHPDQDPNGEVLDTALESVVAKPAQTPTGERFLNLPQGIDADRLAAWGFGKEAALYLYALNRAGLHRFLSFATSRYGEVDALANRRARKRRVAAGD